MDARVRGPGAVGRRVRDRRLGRAARPARVLAERRRRGAHHRAGPRGHGRHRVAALVGAVALEAVPLIFADSSAARVALVPRTAEHAAFVLLAASAHVAFLRGLVLRQQAEHRKRLAEEVQRRRDEAREFRLIATALPAESRAPRGRGEEEQRLAEGAVETIHASMYYTLELLKSSLDLQTCVLLWLDDSGARLKIKELVTDSDCVVETTIGADAGAL